MIKVKQRLPAQTLILLPSLRNTSGGRSKLRPQLIYSIILENVIWLPITLKFSEAGQKIKRTELGYSALTIVFSFVIVYLSFIIPDPMM